MLSVKCMVIWKNCSLFIKTNMLKSPPCASECELRGEENPPEQYFPSSP